MIRDSSVVDVDCFRSKLSIPVPVDSVIATIEDPTVLSDPWTATREALSHPIGMPPLRSWVSTGSRVTVAFDDPTRPARARQVTVRVVLEELVAAGVKLSDIRLISAGGNHRKFRPSELETYLGPDIAELYAKSGVEYRVETHDCSDRDKLIDLGTSAMGASLVYNRCLVDSDYVIYCGNISPNNWGGLSGTGVVTGLAGWASIRSTHQFAVTDAPASLHSDHRTSLFRRHKEAIMKGIEGAMPRPVFYVDTLTGVGGQPAAVVAGRSPEVNQAEWDLAERLFGVQVPECDVLIVGLPERLNYSGSENPLTFATCMMVPARMWVNRPVLRDGGVIIGIGNCAGSFDEPTFTPWKQVFALWDTCHSTRDLSAYEDDFAARPDLLELYRSQNAFHPLHAFWLFYECQYIFDRFSVIAVGNVDPKTLRQLNIEPMREFETAWRRAVRLVGRNPRVLVLPDFWSRFRLQLNVTT